ncbi:MAG: ribonuclease R [Acidobacteria bacterium]|nr:ribonuclease R [Acidobacteriota bacterium]
MRRGHGQKLDTLRGRIDQRRRGFAFLLPEDDSGRDVFLPRRALAGALHGDRVEVRLTAGRRDGRREGIVVAILERAVQRITGRFRAIGREGEIDPFDRRFFAAVRILPEGIGGARDGQIVGCELTRPPGRIQPAEARVVEILGYPDDPEAALRLMIWKHGLREEFPPPVWRECEGLPAEVGAEHLDGREDLRHLPAITIDPPTARDHDDAVSVALEDGGYRIWVHIADVARFVPAGSALDLEARARGNSVYFPGFCLPMLPEPLSGRLCSLIPGRDRLTLTVSLRVGGDGPVGDPEFLPGVIRSRARMTYGEVAEILEGNPGRPLPDGLPREWFLDLQRAAGILHQGRRARGSLDLDLPEPEVLVDDRGEMIGIDPGERNAAHTIVEEFMLAANEAVARRLFRARVPALYRVHDRPDPMKLEAFNEVLEGFGFNLPGPYLNIPPRVFQDLLDRIHGRPEEPFLTRLILRSLQQARYSEEPRGHFGLAATLYTHFTSPIRRYPDLVVHRLLRRVLAGPAIEPGERDRMGEEMPAVARHTSRTERVAEEAEREMTTWKTVGFLADRLGEEFSGFLTVVTPAGCGVSLDGWFVEGWISVEALPDDRYRFLEGPQVLRGQSRGAVYRIGDRVRVRLDRVGVWPPRLDCSPVGDGRSRGARRPAARRF